MIIKKINQILVAVYFLNMPLSASFADTQKLENLSKSCVYRFNQEYVSTISDYSKMLSECTYNLDLEKKLDSCFKYSFPQEHFYNGIQEQFKNVNNESRIKIKKDVLEIVNRKKIFSEINYRFVIFLINQYRIENPNATQK